MTFASFVFTESRRQPVIIFGNSRKSFNGQYFPLLEKCTRVRWSEEEISCVEEVFAYHFKKRTLPAQAEIENQQGNNPILRSRSWQQMKAYINNQQKKGSRK